MGVIKRQSIKESAVKTLSLIIGGLSTLFIYPLNLETYGEIVSIIQMAALFIPFAFLGGRSLIIKFFPSFNDTKENENRYFTFIVLYHFISLTLFTIAYILFFDKFVLAISKLGMDESPFRLHKWYILVLIYLMGFSELLTFYVNNYKRIVIPSIFNNLLQKISLSLLILLLSYSFINTYQVYTGVIFYWILTLVGLTVYLYKINPFKFSYSNDIFKRVPVKEFLVYAGFGILGSMGVMLAMRIDIVMIRLFLTPEDAGIYSIGIFIAGTLMIAANALITISRPIISTSLQNKDYETLRIIYSKSSINLLIIGVFIFINIMGNIEYVFSLSSKSSQLMLSVNVIFWIGLSKIIDLLSSIGGQILSYSSLFRFNLVVILLLAVCNITLNYYLISSHGISGAAIATAISIGVFNLSKIIIIWIKFKMHPFTSNTLIVFLFSILSYGCVVYFPKTPYVLLDVSCKTLLSIITLIVPIMYFKISSDFNDLILGIINRFIKKKNN